jgi:hypothetical protein
VSKLRRFARNPYLPAEAGAIIAAAWQAAL